ncbi:MAG: DUF116 domain-containing protein [Candidatus Kapabacteria bacterium]|nr:DUF116 domain-containing protein [Candidatus Kapabacteria bacterium]
MTDVKIDVLKELPISGKTYSLFGSSENTDMFYKNINLAVEDILLSINSPRIFTEKIISVAFNKRKAKQWVKKNPIVLSIIDKYSFGEFTKNVNSHLSELKILQKYDKTLAATELQYHLFFILIFLLNKLNKQNFKNSDYKFALLPHCLHDLTRECLAKPDDTDFLCAGCSKNCFVKEISSLLNHNNIKPYIWMKLNLRNYLKKISKTGRTVGVLGIACIPELARGMARCYRYNVPALGLPLNANRCIRWFGEFLPNSINMKELKGLIR